MRQRAVVLGETFRQPQLAGHVRPLEIERLERARPDALDVPPVEELVRDAGQQRSAPGSQRRGGRQNRAVAVLHAVARRRRAGSRRGMCSGRVRTAGTRRRFRAARARSARCRGRSRRPRRASRRDESPRRNGWCSTVNSRITTGPNSTGESIRYCRFGAVNSSGDAPGCSWVATCQASPAGGSNVQRWPADRRVPCAHMTAAGMLMWACVESMAR